ncbi:MAG: hypothetical protein E7467_06595 [Ruminococcaceae bacterium]|nr:hypothetical protein [Oscillospiraceae bacterium]
MKRSYAKPIAYLESYQLNAALTLSCSAGGAKPINQSETSCSFDHGQFFSFINCAVDLTGDELDGNDTICYHGPIATGGVTFAFS